MDGERAEAGIRGGDQLQGNGATTEGAGATRGASLIVGVGVLEPWEGMK